MRRTLRVRIAEWLTRDYHDRAWATARHYANRHAGLVAERDYWKRRAIYRECVPHYKHAQKSWRSRLTEGLR